VHGRAGGRRCRPGLFPQMQDDVEQADGDDDNTAELQDKVLLEG
jgi:hypothetical protein